MTLKQLRMLIENVPSAYDEREVKVWLPGSTISLEFNGGKPLLVKDRWLIEGNVDEGSALIRD